MTDAAKEFFQSHECNGYRAKVTIEWSIPEDTELAPGRDATVEGIAGDALAKISAAPYEMVLAMMGRTR